MRTTVVVQLFVHISVQSIIDLFSALMTVGFLVCGDYEMGGASVGERKVLDWSRLFLVRLWHEERVEGSTVEWSGRVMDVSSGKAVSFRDWQELLQLLSDVLKGTWPEQGAAHLVESNKVAEEGGTNNVNK
jgi:hypothetical protein